VLTTLGPLPINLLYSYKNNNYKLYGLDENSKVVETQIKDTKIFEGENILVDSYLIDSDFVSASPNIEFYTKNGWKSKDTENLKTSDSVLSYDEDYKKIQAIEPIKGITKLYHLETGTDNFFVTYAIELGLDVEKFGADYTSSAVNDLVQSDLGSANKLSLRSTPSFPLYFMIFSLAACSSSLTSSRTRTTFFVIVLSPAGITVKTTLVPFSPRMSLTISVSGQ